jgi:CDP-L-myo-inositol myo-inositolphosphotransferase
MKALVIAAGKGSRLKLKLRKDKPKPLVQLLGLSLIERVILNAKQAGIDQFLIVVGYLGEKIEKKLGEGNKYGIKIEYIENAEYERENGVSVLCAKRAINEDENFILLMSDHIFEWEILVDLIRKGEEELEEGKGGECILCVDKKPKSKYVDLEEATKVKIENNHIVDIGKEIKDYDGVDCGIFVLSPSIFEALEESIRNGDETLSGGIKVGAEKGKVKAFDVGDKFWIDIDTKGDYRKAKRILCEGLTKPTDGVISRYINRRFSTGVFTPLLLKIYGGVTPNQVSLMSFGVAVISALLFFLSHPLIGGVFIQLSSILDGCDGEIARLKNRGSGIGGFIDAVLDRYADALILLGMFYYSMVTLSNKEIFGFYCSDLIIFLISVLAILGSLMVSYTSARAMSDLSYRHKGNRDLRLFLLFLGGVSGYLYPGCVLFALFIVAIMTNIIVMWRLILSWKMFGE